MHLILDWYGFLSCEPKLFCDCRKSRDKSNICAQLFSTLLHAKKDKKDRKISNAPMHLHNWANPFLECYLNYHNPNDFKS